MHVLSVQVLAGIRIRKKSSILFFSALVVLESNSSRRFTPKRSRPSCCGTETCKIWRSDLRKIEGVDVASNRVALNFSRPEIAGWKFTNRSEGRNVLACLFYQDVECLTSVKPRGIVGLIKNDTLNLKGWTLTLWLRVHPCLEIRSCRRLMTSTWGQTQFFFQLDNNKIKGGEKGGKICDHTIKKSLPILNLVKLLDAARLISNSIPKGATIR